MKKRSEGARGGKESLHFICETEAGGRMLELRKGGREGESSVGSIPLHSIPMALQVLREKVASYLCKQEGDQNNREVKYSYVCVEACQLSYLVSDVERRVRV